MSFSSTFPDIGKHVKNARNQRGWTQRYLAKVAGVSSGVVAKIEAGGTTRPCTVDKVLGALKMQATVEINAA